MKYSEQKIYTKNAIDMSEIKDNSIALVVTSPPYPMIDMWDLSFSQQSEEVELALKKADYDLAYEQMHNYLSKIWDEVDRVLIPGGFVCINIGDATRNCNGVFKLFSNHTKIINYFSKKNYCVLPDILWRKQSNSPNKFMGSGMYPAGAYVTYEHEYILIFRKGFKREFKSEEAKKRRQESAYFWEERNTWFSDLWDIKGIKQSLTISNTRNRSAAFPFDIAYRLINMFSIKGDFVLDPFVGTGTVLFATLSSERNGIGYEIDESIANSIPHNLLTSSIFINTHISERLNRHSAFINKSLLNGQKFKYYNENISNYVKTRQEIDIKIRTISSISLKNNIILSSYE